MQIFGLKVKSTDLFILLSWYTLDKIATFFKIIMICQPRYLSFQLFI